MKFSQIDYKNQLMLKYLGYYDGKLDGLNGALQKRGTSKFQKKYGLIVDGKIGIRTQPILNKAFWKLYQTRLTYIGKYKGIIDGIPGRLTIQGTYEVQRENGLKVDKIVGVKTLAKLDKLVAKQKALAQSKGNQLSAHFTRKEFECGCNGVYCNGFPVEPSKVLLKNLEILRAHFGGKPIRIYSGIRCQAYNDSLSNSIKYSKHVQGKAADLQIEGVCDTEAGRLKVVAFWNTINGANYSYQGTSLMGKSVHVDVK